MDENNKQIKQLMRKTKKQLCEIIVKITNDLWLVTNQTDEEEVIHCPDCGSDKIAYRSDFMSGSIDVACMDCKSLWFEVWNFKGVEMIIGEDNRVDSNE